LKQLLVLLTAITGFIWGCSTTDIPTPATIPIPSGLSEQGVEIAILSAMVVRPPPPVFDPREAMPKEQYEQLVWNYYVTTPTSGGWVIESRDPGAVTGIIKRSGYHLRVVVRHDERAARVSIVDSSGLDQESGSIHENAAEWILKLEARIRSELQQMERK
jgi:hypothetical protein